jgi:hypothetical protein
MLLAGALTFAGDANNGTTMPHNKSNAGVQRLQQRPKRAKRSLASGVWQFSRFPFHQRNGTSNPLAGETVILGKLHRGNAIWSVSFCVLLPQEANLVVIL